ncbi:magnesium/cobalt transporter CorA [Aggregatimonas sangjinii]|uniref:Magnesium transport protein CorA n=1 Tax=Aggregatimonas sangjinii TaxID=2583587 RepID=A0A5B7SUG8_9FLAO|nr:magnesium/cobalt transporter CorA [Aggregatimonas sangjinii]QCX00688.1 magnesium/cobalt transporter CorA [Aggregatimonas sangjinii]
MHLNTKDILSVSRSLTGFAKKRKEDIGLAPDDISFRGERKMDQVVLRMVDYDAKDFKEETIGDIQTVLEHRKNASVTWFNIDGLHDTNVIENIAEGFDFDKLVLAEVMDVHARPKVHDFSNCILLSIKMLQQDEQSGRISVENLSLIITDSVLLSFQERRGDVFEPVRERIRTQKKRIRNGGTDYLTFALLDIVIDNYIYIIGLLGEKIETLEENLLTEPKKSVIDEIYTYKRKLNFLRKNITPAKEMILSLSKVESEVIKESTQVHFKELLDNINQAVDASETYRDILSDQLNIYHTTISTKLNDIMKFLTIFSVIFIPLTFIAGIYGTNFEVVPELKYEYSYFIMWGVMIVVAIGMLLYFKKRKWL